MSEDEAERVYLVSSNAMAYAFEPVMRRRVERPVFAEDEGAAAAPDGDGSEERFGNTSWCKCGHCSAMPTTVESVCCHEADLDNVLGELSCITLSRTFQMLCGERDVLEVAMLSLREVRAERLERPISSRWVHAKLT